jgi:hypothetical protein
MFAIYFNSATGRREFVSTVEDQQQAFSMARLLSRQDARDVLVIENRHDGGTNLRGTFRKGEKVDGGEGITGAASGAKIEDP